jgi:hypothetical protein
LVFLDFNLLLFHSTNQTNNFRSGNGKRGGARGTGRSRNGWTNTSFRKKHYGSKKKDDDDKTNDSSQGKKRGGGGGRGRGRGRGGGQTKKKNTQ